MHVRTRPLAAWSLAAAATVLLLTAACSSKSASSKGGGAATTPVTGSTSASTGSGGASGAAMVQTTKGSLGTFITDTKGHTLYVFAADTSNASTCYGLCAQFWPPVLTSGAPTAGSGADAAKLGTSPRTDGTTQVTYNGHPLYTFSLDSAAGDTKGQGLNQQGGLWWVVGVDGNAITGAAAGSSSSSSGRY